MLKSDHTHDKDGLVCNHVQKRKRPARIIAHDKDGVWQFMCGMDDHTNPKQAKKTCVICAFDKYAGDLTREDVPQGHIARRANSKGEWTVREMTQDEIDAIDEPDGESAT